MKCDAVLARSGSTSGADVDYNDAYDCFRLSWNEARAEGEFDSKFDSGPEAIPSWLFIGMALLLRSGLLLYFNPLPSKVLYTKCIFFC